MIYFQKSSQRWEDNVFFTFKNLLYMLKIRGRMKYSSVLFDVYLKKWGRMGKTKIRSLLNKFNIFIHMHKKDRKMGRKGVFHSKKIDIYVKNYVYL